MNFLLVMLIIQGANLTWSIVAEMHEYAIAFNIFCFSAILIMNLVNGRNTL